MSSPFLLMLDKSLMLWPVLKLVDLCCWLQCHQHNFSFVLFGDAVLLFLNKIIIITGRS
jgi:hypothetical protein